MTLTVLAWEPFGAPSGAVIKPNPFESLNHFTVPVVSRNTPPRAISGTGWGRAPCATYDSLDSSESVARVARRPSGPVPRSPGPARPAVRIARAFRWSDSGTSPLPAVPGESRKGSDTMQTELRPKRPRARRLMKELELPDRVRPAAADARARHHRSQDHPQRRRRSSAPRRGRGRLRFVDRLP